MSAKVTLSLGAMLNDILPKNRAQKSIRLRRQSKLLKQGNGQLAGGRAVTRAK